MENIDCRLMILLSEVVEFLDKELKMDSIPDYPNAYNGLQVENSGKVTKVAAAVDASLDVIQKAVREGVDLIVVHHGLYWQGVQPVKGAWKKKLQLIMDNDIAVYSAHIPLDVHPKYGNNAILANRLNLTDQSTFLQWKGIEMGVSGNTDLDFDSLVERLGSVLGEKPHFSKASNEVGQVGVITGGAGSEIQAVSDCGVNTFITGEGQHWTYYLAKELNVNLIYGGHYLTETFGVESVCGEIKEKFGVSYLFLEDPSGL